MRSRRSIGLRSPGEIDAMAQAGAVVAAMHTACRAAVAPGVTTGDLDAVARDVLHDHGATSNFLGYHGFPAVICVSVNEEVVHGIPGRRALRDGDVVSIDCGAVVDGWHGDAAFTVGVGEIDPTDSALIEAGRESLDAGIRHVRPGARMGDIGHAVESVARAAGATLLADHGGHGIGRAMHEAPDVPNTGVPGTGLRLEVGMVLAIEPMLCAGVPNYRVLDDDWTVVTADGRRSVHWEHTIAVTATGPRILTLPPDAR